MIPYDKPLTDIPTLFITFARPEFARITFDAIKNAKPSKLYFYSNKARRESLDEVERNNQIREYVSEIDWKCTLKTFFREEYVDMYTSIWSAIDWVFENEEQAIILEEDCVPSLAFFDFCEQLLPKFKDDQRVWVISGNNFIEGYNPNGYDYFFSPFAFQYGWASWKSRWDKLNKEGFSVDDILQYDLYRQIYGTRKGANDARKQLTKLQNANGMFCPVAWDYTFQMTMRCNGGFGIIPARNLVSNIGVTGVHTTSLREDIHNRPMSNEALYPIIIHPPFIVTDFKYTNRFFNKIINKKVPKHKRALRYMKKIILKYCSRNSE